MALLGFAYLPRPLGRALRRAESQVVEILTYAEGVPPHRETGKHLSEDDLRRAQGEVRRLLYFLILSDEANARSLGAATLDVSYSRQRGGPIEWRAIARPIQIRVMVAALAVLADALPWLDRCVLCGRIFFRVRVQRFCSRPCANVFHAREASKDAVYPSSRWRKGGGKERRGRPRIDYMARTEVLHAEFPES
jgi:hypothetical protein